MGETESIINPNDTPQARQKDSNFDNLDDMDSNGSNYDSDMSRVKSENYEDNHKNENEQNSKEEKSQEKNNNDENKLTSKNEFKKSLDISGNCDDNLVESLCNSNIETSDLLESDDNEKR